MNKQLFLKRKRKAIRKVLKRGYLSCIKITKTKHPKWVKDVLVLNVISSCNFHIDCIKATSRASHEQYVKPKPKGEIL